MIAKPWTQRIVDFSSGFPSETFQSRSTKLAYVFMAVLAAYSIVRGVAAAAARPFWFDELLTLAIASQPNLRDMWTAITRGFDSQPPLFYLLERACLRLPLRSEIALRLPSILCFPLLLLCVFSFLRERFGELMACLCTFVLLSTSLFHMYQIEARGYMLMNTCLAFAMVCYQRLPSPRWAAMLCFSLLLAESFHYYAVFAMVPFSLAEIVFLLSASKLRWYVWSALVFGALPALACWPLLLTMKIYYGSQFFSRPGFSRWLLYYGSYFMTNYAFGIALAAVSGVAIAWSRLFTNRPSRRGISPKAAALAESTLLLGFVALPLILSVSMRLIHGSLLDRYALLATIGIVSGLASALSLFGLRGIILFSLFAVLGIPATETVFWSNKRTEPLVHEYSIYSLGQFADIELLIRSAGYLSLPVVYAQPMSYSQVVRYSHTDLTKRLVCLVSRVRELQYEKTDTMFRAMEGLSEFYPVRLEGYDQFTATHSEFLLYSEGTEWALNSLLADGASMQLLGADGAMRLYLVKMKKNSPD